MGKPTAPDTTSPSPAQLAKAALRRLAEQRQEPTPDNYRKAYETESGVVSKTDNKPARDEAPALSDDGEQWSQLITRLLRGAERGGRQWTTARKKDSLQRVLEGSKRSAQRLQQRLSQLVNSWDSDTLDNSLLEGDDNAAATAEPTADVLVAATDPAPVHSQPNPQSNQAPDSPSQAPAAPNTQWPPLAAHAMARLRDTLNGALPTQDPQAQEAAAQLDAALAQGQDTALPAALYQQASDDISQACGRARRLIEHRYHLIGQLTDLCHALTDSLVDLSEDDTWVQGQCQAMRHQLSDEGLNPRGVRHVHQLLSETRQRQLTLKHEREAARQALKYLIHQMLQEIGELGTATDRFHTNLGRFVDTIGQADTLESLTGVVREMVEESRAVQSVVAQTQTRLQDEHTRATELTERVKQLEDEIRKLSDEVSTDPLTQIANRRGLMRAFEIERARVERTAGVLSVGLLDVDNFKRLNDQLGHQTGDEALKFLSRRVAECLRPVDIVARYGGEEFVVLLPDTPVDEGQQALTRLQRTLSAEFFTHESKKVFITFSAGVTQYRQDEAIEITLDRADVALYEAKRTGKNRTCTG